MPKAKFIAKLKSVMAAKVARGSELLAQANIDALFGTARRLVTAPPDAGVVFARDLFPEHIGTLGSIERYHSDGLSIAQSNAELVAFARSDAAAFIGTACGKTWA
jgi:hypothetical protein